MGVQKPIRGCLRSLAWVRERVGYSAASICDIFRIEPAQQSAFLTKLLEHRIVRRRTPSDSTREIDNETFENYLNHAEYAFCYVGMYVYNERMVYILPKYADIHKLAAPEFAKEAADMNPERRNLFILILKAIQRYHSKRLESELHIEQENPIHNDLALMVTIVSDYAEHGEYRNEHQIEYLNGTGRHMWAHTINRQPALIQQDSLIYTDIITRRRTREHNHPITILHRKIVSECYSSLAQFGITELLELPAPTPEDTTCMENAEDDYLLYLVEAELTRQFDSRRRHILELLKAYLSHQSSPQKNAEPEYAFGCSSFHMLWEEACRSVLGYDISRQIQIKPPVWNLNRQLYEAPASLIPGMIFSTGQGTWIIDAKYYLPLPNRTGNLPLGLPGTNDITKQFLYQQALHSQDAHCNSGKKISQPIFNAFLMPAPLSTATSPVKHYATVTMPLFPELKIEVLQIAPDALLTCYTGQTSPTLMREQLKQQLLISDSGQRLPRD